MDLRLGGDADLMWNDVPDGPGNFETGVHASPQKDSMHAIVCLPYLTPLVVNSAHLNHLIWFVVLGVDVVPLLTLSLFCVDLLGPLFSFGRLLTLLSPDVGHAVAYPAYKQLLLRLNDQRRCAPTQQVVKLEFVLFPLLQLLSGVFVDDVHHWVMGSCFIFYFVI